MTVVLLPTSFKFKFITCQVDVSRSRLRTTSNTKHHLVQYYSCKWAHIAEVRIANMKLNDRSQPDYCRLVCDLKHNIFLDYRHLDVCALWWLPLELMVSQWIMFDNIFYISCYSHRILWEIEENWEKITYLVCL